MKMKLAAELKQFFFDRPAVLKKLKKKKLNALKKAGALSRRIIRNKPRRRKRKSRPGEAPSVHAKSKFATLRNVLFAYDPSTDGVVVGPVKIPTTDTEPAPATLEYGGRIDRRKKRSLGGSGEVEVDGRRIAADGSPRRVNRGRRGGGSSMSTIVDSDGEQRSVVYAKLRTDAQVQRANDINEELYGPTSKTPVIEPRPFVAPAMTEAAPAFPELYATSPAG